MSRRFRKSCLDRPYQAIRGWYKGKNREAAKSARYNLISLVDEDGVPDLPSMVNNKWRRLGHPCRKKPLIKIHKIIRRNGRKYMVKIKNLSIID